MSSQAPKDDLIIPWRHARYYTVQYDGSSSDPLIPNQTVWTVMCTGYNSIRHLLFLVAVKRYWSVKRQDLSSGKNSCTNQGSQGIDQRDVLRRWRCSHCTYRRSPTSTNLLLGHCVKRAGKSAAHPIILQMTISWKWWLSSLIRVPPPQATYP